jgi:hypothetical protein
MGKNIAGQFLRFMQMGLGPGKIAAPEGGHADIEIDPEARGNGHCIITGQIGRGMIASFGHAQGQMFLPAQRQFDIAVSNFRVSAMEDATSSQMRESGAPITRRSDIR